MIRNKCPAIFLDRDGTIIEDLHYPKDPNGVTLILKAVEGLRLMQKKGYTLFVVSNQSGVGRGLITQEQFEAVHARCHTLLQQNGITIAHFAYCFHRPQDDCACRKPRTGLIPHTHDSQILDWSASYVVGDREGDIGLGNNLKATTYLVETGGGKETAAKLAAGHSVLRYKISRNLLEVAKDIPTLS